jgi:hypothetical protein
MQPVTAASARAAEKAPGVAGAGRPILLRRKTTVSNGVVGSVIVPASDGPSWLGSGSGFGDRAVPNWAASQPRNGLLCS